MILDKKYELPMTKEYVSHWDMSNAIRELIQNAIDSESPLEWEFTDDTLFIHSRFTKLEPKTLLLGSTSKAENVDAIGSFGEGYKIAILVLTRLGYEVIIHNNKLDWRPKFNFSEKYDSEILYIVESSAPHMNEGLTFEIKGLDESDMDEIKESCLLMQDSIGQIRHTPKGLILFDKSGKLYVGGLYICDTDLKYGYDINPRYISLERDRQTVSSWDLKQITKEMWFATDNKDFIAELMKDNVPDIEYARYGSPEIVKEACYKLFQKEHPDCITVDSQEELNRLVKEGMTNTVYTHGGYYSAVTSSSNYKKSVVEKPKMNTINEIMTKFLDNNRKYMKRQAIVEFKKLMGQSNTWVKKDV